MICFVSASAPPPPALITVFAAQVTQSAQISQGLDRRCTNGNSRCLCVLSSTNVKDAFCYLPTPPPSCQLQVVFSLLLLRVSSAFSLRGVGAALTALMSRCPPDKRQTERPKWTQTASCHHSSRGKSAGSPVGSGP